MTVNLVSAFNNLAQLEIEAMAALSTPKTADAVPWWFHTQESFPYFINRVGDFANVDEYGEEIDFFQYTVQVGLVIGHITSGYIGENAANLLTYIPHLVEWFNEHEDLKASTAPYNVNIDDLIRCRCLGGNGSVEFPNSPAGVRQVGALFTLRMEFEYPIVQASY